MATRKRSNEHRETDLRGQMAGEYKIVRKLGTGGFGTVYEAEHPVLKRKAAVKVLHADRNVDSPAVQRFFAEAQSASQIRHRHVVDIFSFGKLPNGQHFYVMDLLEGAPLDEYLRQLTRLDPSVALLLLRPIASALDALHSHGIVHRDVKPPNIYLAWESDDEVVPKLLDFGLVKLLADAPLHTASGVPMGTPYYMSPEQCRGEKVDARSDVYAFGVICYELLSGAPPFTGDTPAAVLVAHLVKDPPRLSEQFPELPAALDLPILHMLQKDASARPSSVGAALLELEQAMRDAGIAIPEGPPHLERIRMPVLEEDDLSPSLSDFGAGGPSLQSSSSVSPLFWVVGLVAVSVAAGSIYSLAGGFSSSATAEVSSSATGAPAPVASEPMPPVSPSATAASVTSAAGISAPAASVGLVLEGTPRGAQVRLDGQLVGTVPGTLALPRGSTPLELVISASGYETKTVRVVPDADRNVDVLLTRGGRGPARKRSVPTDLENPF